jgi:hypothetical protein
MLKNLRYNSMIYEKRINSSKKNSMVSMHLCETIQNADGIFKLNQVNFLFAQ